MVQIGPCYNNFQLCMYCFCKASFIFLEPINITLFYTKLYVCRAWKWRVAVDQRVSLGKVGHREGPFTSTKSACSIVTTCLLYYKRCRLRSSMLKNLVSSLVLLPFLHTYKGMLLYMLILVSFVCALLSLFQPCKNYWDNGGETDWILIWFSLKSFSILIYFIDSDSQCSLDLWSLFNFI